MNLIYMASPTVGGWVSFTAHLALKENATVYKLSKRSEKSPRQFGYGVTYRNTAVWPAGNTLITALDKHHYNRLNLIPQGTYLVVHDPTEITKTLSEHIYRFRIITIRKSVHRILPNSIFLPHPFFPFPLKVPNLVRTPISISRIDWDKNIDVIIAANELGADITLWGAPNRLYIHHAGLNIANYYRGAFPKSFEAIADILASASCIVDMSSIKHDGGGSQYTFLEAIYGGLPLILNKKWTDVNDSIWDESNCAAVSTPEELYDATQRTNLPIAMQLLLPHLQTNWSHHLFPLP